MEAKACLVSAATVIVKLTVSMSLFAPLVAVLPSASTTVTVTEYWPLATAVAVPELGEPVIWPDEELIERPPGRPVALYLRSPLPPLTEGISIAVIVWPSIAFRFETLPPNEGDESAATCKVKLNDARSLLVASLSESLAVQVTVVLPVAVGVPEMVRVEALQLRPVGRAVLRSA